MNPLVSVITSTYNWPKALEQAIPTVLSQTFSDFEYLIIGDCCTDETEELVYGFNDARINWYNLPQNTGNQSGVNKFALTKSKGKYIAYLNHDDLWFPDHLEIALSAFRGRDLDIVNTLSLEIDVKEGHNRAILGLPALISPRLRNVLGLPKLISPSSPMTTSVMHTAEAANLVGGWTDWRETYNVPTQEFFKKLQFLRQRWAVVSSVTSLKFHSGDRKNSYLIRNAYEQKIWANQIKQDPNLRLRETLTALACTSMRESKIRLSQPRKPDNAPLGWQIEQWRRMRGLKPMLNLGESEPKNITPENITLSSPIQTKTGDWTVISPISDENNDV